MSISVLVLERTGGWRSAGLAAVSACALVPLLPLLSGIFQMPVPEFLDNSEAFAPVLMQSLGASIAGSGIALVLGLAAGVMHSLYRFRWASLLRFIFVLPVTVPPLMWAAGIRNMSLSLLKGHAGVVFITVMTTFPLVMLATISACSLLSAGQCDAARLAGGEARLFRLAAVFSLPAAVVAACLGGCLMLSCPGPALALGARTAVSEILVSFSAFYDSSLAAIQCVWLSAGVLVLALSAIFLSGRRPAEILAAGTRKFSLRYEPAMSGAAFAFSLCCALFLVVLPLSGLVLPAIAIPDLPILKETLSRTVSNSVIYAAGSATVATCLGTAAAFFMGKSQFHRNVGAGIMLVIFSLPAALTGLGFLTLAADAPAWTDFLFRSPAAICLAQGIRLFPLPALLAARSFNSMPASWSWAAALHNISFACFMKKIAGPMLARSVITGFMITFLLAQADVGTVLLLHPPGAQNLPLAMFTIMANAPTAVVAQLAIVHMVFALLTLLLIIKLWNMKGAWERSAR